MPRGGKRQATPGKAYPNRTDMAINYDMAKGSPAAGGVEAPRGAGPMRLPIYPEDTPSLSTPTQRPGEPISDGLMSGPGRGPEAMTGLDPRMAETVKLKRWLPLLEPMANDPESPESVRVLVQYIRGAR